MAKRIKGQITIFIIIGLLILVILGFATLLWKPSMPSLQKEEHASGLQVFIQECFEQTTKSAIEDVSVQGGYFYTPDPALDTHFIIIPYYIDEGKVFFPTKQEIAENMELYIKSILPFCTGTFHDFKESVGTITPGEIDVAVVLDETIQATLSYPITLERDNTIETVDAPYTAQTPINFNEIYGTVNRIMSEQEKTPNALPIGFLTAHASSNNYTFTLSYVDDNTVTITLTFPQYLIDQKEYQFVFGMQYNWSSLKVPIDTINLSIHNETCYVGDPCYIELNIYNESISFEDMTQMFDMDPSGQIKFIPKETDAGNHTISVLATAESGWQEYISFNLEIRTLSGVTP